ncbi:MAG TPA: AAA family ATPase [Rhodocyclaceae bacterium]|nr:AAA family ATPase [Rhodocyclaceae bacterium]
MSLTPLSPEALYSPCDPTLLGFVDTGTAGEPDLAFAHPRAVEALRLGLDMRHPGYNLFVLGETGSGRHAVVRQLLDAERKNGQPPADWCYVNNFAEAARPNLLRLPAGRGGKLRDDMQRFAEELGPAIAAAFESDQYRSRIESLQEEAKRREEEAVSGLGRDSAAMGIGLLRTPQGFVFMPLKGEDETLSREEFDKLPEDKQQELGKRIEELHERLHKLMNQFPRWRRELQASVRQASRDALQLAAGHLIEELEPAYADLPEVVAFLDAVLHDVIESGESLRETARSEGEAETTLYSGAISVQRYLVNLLVDNSGQDGRPVIYESHPTLQNLVGRVEHMVHMGMLVSNFTLVKAGALHRANGGFLVLDAVKLLTQPYAWEGLKRALRAGAVRIESLTEMIGLSSTVQLEPQPVPLDVKIVLVGERLVYYLLSELDPDFPALFKIAADFESEIERGAASTAHYGRLLAHLARRNELRPFTAAAVARVVEHAARLAGDADRLTARTQPIADLLREADHHAGQAGAERTERVHVEGALAARRRRHERLREKFHEEILRGQLLISTAGEHTGQINGLAVVALGEATFAHPVRITASVRLGDGEVIDIEREVELGGPIHSKGVMILSAFLAGRFGWSMPLSLKASLVFEQSYGGVEGDSASLAELCALLSALAAAPIRQGIAVTGSVNQFGVVQPVGAINEKIEGFFDICQARGFDGEQGVAIPAANRRHLMLRPEVVAAVRDGRFRIWAVENVDQAMELLTGIPAGEPDAKGVIPPDTLNYRIVAQLAELAAARQEFARPKAPRRKRPKARKPAAPPVPPVIPGKDDKG